MSDPGWLQATPALRSSWRKMKSALLDRNTGLYSYHYHLDDLQALVEWRPRLGVVYVEVFHLDRIERLCGWQAFDRLLERMSAELQGLRGSAYATTALLAVSGRHGGSFVLFLPENLDGSETTPGDLEVVALRIRRGLAEILRRDFPSEGVPEAYLGVGHSLIRWDPVVRMERSVYHAIEEARLLSERAPEHEDRRSGDELRQIIRAGLVQTYFQPIVDLPSGEVYGYEALARGPLHSRFETPGAMFGYSERMKLSPLLDSVCRRRALLAARGLESGKKLFLNALPQTLSDPGFADAHAKELLAGARLPASEVVLEITERTGIDDFERFGRRLAQLRNLGFRVAIDDVGTGYSSLQTISEVRPEFLKIDLSLVKGIHESLIKREIVSSILQIGERIGASVIAEGIESPAEFETIKNFGVRLAQGFYLGAPSPAFPRRAETPSGDH